MWWCRFNEACILHSSTRQVANFMFRTLYRTHITTAQEANNSLHICLEMNPKLFFISTYNLTNKEVELKPKECGKRLNYTSRSAAYVTIQTGTGAWNRHRISKNEKQSETKITQDRQCTHNVIWRRFRLTTVAMEKQEVLHIVSVSVTLVIQHATRMRHIILSVACVAPQHFSTLCHKRHDFSGEKLLNIKCVLIYLQFYLKHFSF